MHAYRNTSAPFATSGFTHIKVFAFCEQSSMYIKAVFSWAALSSSSRMLGSWGRRMAAGLVNSLNSTRRNGVDSWSLSVRGLFTREPLFRLFNDGDKRAGNSLTHYVPQSRPLRILTPIEIPQKSTKKCRKYLNACCGSPFKRLFCFDFVCNFAFILKFILISFVTLPYNREILETWGREVFWSLLLRN